jgi:hypothetical protein
MKPIVFIAIAAVWLAAAPALSQQYYYPTKGQSPDQQNLDQQECSGWAMQQSGYNPAQAGAPPPSGGMVRGAAGGAALGAVGGAIAGDAGEGAAIGAATGALFGGVRQHRQRRQQSAQAQQSADAFNRAMAACMQGRGYSVQ